LAALPTGDCCSSTRNFTGGVFQGGGGVLTLHHSDPTSSPTTAARPFHVAVTNRWGERGNLGDVVVLSQPHLLPQLVGRLLLAVVAAVDGRQQLHGLLPPQGPPVLLGQRRKRAGYLLPAPHTAPMTRQDERCGDCSSRRGCERISEKDPTGWQRSS